MAVRNFETEPECAAPSAPSSMNSSASSHHSGHPGGAAKKIVVGIIGGTITLIGIALLVLPGPAFIIIPIGLSILATQFLWARRWLKKVRTAAAKATSGKTRARQNSG